MAIEIEPQSKVTRIVANADPGEFMVFLGAGASKSSGVPLAGEMIAEWRKMMHRDQGPVGSDCEEWCHAQPWFGIDEEYSTLFENLFPNPRARQKYVEPKIEQGFPSWCYLYLASLIHAGHFNVVFTTNFDDLVNDALSMFLGYNPVVCAADSQVGTINVVTRRAKIIKLHGDYLFKQLKNTVEELQELDPNMGGKFAEFSKQCGMVVVGYAGRDRSVMRVIDEVMTDPESFPCGVWWGTRHGDDVHPNLARLAAKHPRRFKLFLCPDFDDFMAELHSNLKLPLPETVLHPYEAVKERFARLATKEQSNPFGDSILCKHIAELEAELDRPWTKESDRSALDLLQAQLAIGRRDHAAALKAIESYLKEKKPDAACLAAWGDALVLKAEADSDPAAGKQALEKWREAIQLEPDTLTARYSLLRYGSRHQLIDESVRVAEELRRLVPGDLSLRRSFAQLLMQQGRPGEALGELAELLKIEPQAADLYAMRCGACEQGGLIADGLLAIEQAVALEPSNPWYRFSYANGLTRAGKIQRAGEEYRRTVEIAPSNLGFRLQIAQYFTQRQMPAEAIQHLEQARVIEPSSAEVRGWLAELYLMSGRIPEARREVDEACRLSPNDARILINRGIIALREGAIEDAENALSQAILANPLAPQAHYWLCLLRWTQNRMPEAQSERNLLGTANPQAVQTLDGQIQFLSAQSQGDPRHRLQALQRMMSQPAAPFPSGPPGPPPLPR